MIYEFAMDSVPRRKCGSPCSADPSRNLTRHRHSGNHSKRPQESINCTLTAACALRNSCRALVERAADPLNCGRIGRIDQPCDLNSRPLATARRQAQFCDNYREISDRILKTTQAPTAIFLSRT